MLSVVRTFALQVEVEREVENEHDDADDAVAAERVLRPCKEKVNLVNQRRTQSTRGEPSQPEENPVN